MPIASRFNRLDWDSAFLNTGGTGEMNQEDTTPSTSVERKNETKEENPVQRPTSALFSKNLTGKEILARFGIML